MERKFRPAILPWRRTAAFLVLAAVIVSGGFVFYRHQRSRMRAEAANDLEAICSLKAEDISAWLKERLGDAEVLTKSPLLARNIERWLANPKHSEAGLDTRTRLESILVYDMYESIILCDLEGKVRQVYGKNHRTLLGQATREFVFKTAGDNCVLFSDFYLCDHDSQVHLDVFAPLQDGRRVTAVVILRIDPYKHLFPLVQSWPVPTKSSETLVLRRQGDSALFLNDLRFRKDAAMKFKITLSDTLVPAAMAALGREGIVEGKDYRGVPVLASIKKIPGSPWHMVAKVDKEEVYRPVRLMTIMVVGSVSALILLVGSLLMAFYQREQKQLLDRLLEIERQRQVLIKHYDYLTKYANDCIIVLDENRRIIEANQRAVEVYGYSRDELLGMNVVQLRAEEQKPMFAGQLQEALEKGGSVYETQHRRKDGTVFPVEISVRPIEIEGRTYIQGIMRDITERKQAQEKLQKAHEELQASYEEIEANNQELHAAEEELQAQNENLQKAEHELRLALQQWQTSFDAISDGMALLDTQQRILKCNRAFGAILGKEPSLLLGQECRQLLQLGENCRQNCPFERMKQTGTRQPLEFEFNQRQYESVADPIFDAQGRLEGAVYIIKDITERKLMEQKLAKSEEMFRLLAENSSDIVYRYELLPHRGFRYVSPAAKKIVGYSPQEHYDDPDLGYKIIHPEDRHLLDKIASGEIDPTQPLELRWKAKDGRIVWVEQRNRHIYDQGGKLVAIEGVARDITQRRQAEEALGYQRHLSEIMADASPSIVVSLGPESRILSFNAYAEKLTGYQASEVLGKRWIDLFIPEGRRQELLDLWQEIVEKGYIEHHYVNPILTKDGGERIISWSNTVVKKGGKFEMVLSIGEDVTERALAEQKIKRQFEEINAMYQAMLDREDRVRELKEEVNEILSRQGLPPKYVVK